MHPSFILQTAEGAFTLYLKYNFLKAADAALVAVYDVHVPVLGLSIAGIHAEEVGGK